jgi:hypothetical protein
MGREKMTQRGGGGEDNQHGQVILGSQPPKYIFGGQPLNFLNLNTKLLNNRF